MSTVKNISNIENKELSKGQLDKLEGTEEYWQKTETNYIAVDISENNYMFKYFNDMLEDKSGLIEIHNIQTGRRNNKSKNTYCMYTMWFDTANKISLRILQKIIESFAEYAVIVKEPYKLIDRYDSALMDYFRTHKYLSTPILGFVRYINIENKGIAPLGIYRKKNNFVYQNEFRFCLGIQNNNNDLCYFEAGDLSYIVTSVKTEDLVYKTKIVENYFVTGDAEINFNLSKY